MNEYQALIDQYTKWLKDKTHLREVNDWVEITTPFLDRHNDHLQIYIKKNNDDEFLLTDDGYILNDLIISGCNIDTPKREQLLATTLNGYGVKLDKNSLTVNASSANFALKKHNLIQAMLSVNDLFYLATPWIKSIFLEDVTEWLRQKNVRAVPNIKLTGKSGYDHRFEFVIPASLENPERMIKTINRPTRDAAEQVAFAWMDTKEARGAESIAYAVINDSEHKVGKTVVEALKSYAVKPILWSEREKFTQELVA
jgi:hypothetical protein